MARVLLGIALAVQAVGVALAAFGELRRRPPLARAGVAAFVIAWLLELSGVATVVAIDGAIPLRNGPEYMLTLGFLVLTIHLTLWFKARIGASALVLPPVSTLMLLVGFSLQGFEGRVGIVPTRGWFVFHTSVATAGVAALAVSFAMSVLFLVKERALKEKRSLSVLERLPALEALDRLGFRWLLYGFPLLTLGIGTGMVYSSAVHDQLWIWGLKEIFPLLAWIVFAILLWARFAQGIRGRRSAILAIAGFALALLTFVGMVR